ncbi:Protein JTB [Amphibalanus amphitrite]|uniref:Protein JTB n=1 Tax=Amphibalanus amphitrite TaxID=1232801 RepID=A0A6A4WG94_AMPAM|nr:Protein JTB [Amphibalanus amphitrite]KAF0304259.1 Protein JTB [Amphibalanus amphitrite]
MIELCSRRRMIAAIIVLVCVSIIIVLLENILTPDGVHGRRVAVSSEAPLPAAHNLSSALPATALPESAPGQRHCWESQTFTVARPCRRCTGFEKASGSVPECGHSDYIELLNCEKDGKVYRGCDGARDQGQRQFWLLELISLCSALVSGGAVIVRQRQLERTALGKIQRQLAAQV